MINDTGIPKKWIRPAAVCTIVAAALVGLSIWAWIISFDRPNPSQIPHLLYWSAVNQNYANHGDPLWEPHHYYGNIYTNPVVRMAARAIDIFGPFNHSVLAVQGIFILLLIIGVAALAWRFFGPFPAVMAAITAALCPTTIGLGQILDDLLANAALTTCALALLAWGTHSRYKYLAAVAPALVIFSMWTSLYLSNALLVMAAFGCGAFGIAFYSWLEKRNGESTSRIGWTILPAALALIFAFVALKFRSDIFQFQYIFSEAEGTGEQLPWQSYFAYPAVWFGTLATPLIAITALISLIAVAINKNWRSILPTLLWLMIPMLLLSLVQKKNFHYLLPMLPATFVLAGAAFTASKRPLVRTAISFAFVVGMLFFLMTKALLPTEGLGIGMNLGFQDTSPGFLYSPNTPIKSAWEINREWIETKCGDAGVFPLYLQPMDADWDQAYFLWASNPKLIEPLTGQPELPRGGVCIMAFLQMVENKDISLSDFVRSLKKSAEESGNYDEWAKNRFNQFISQAPDYPLYARMGDIALYRYQFSGEPQIIPISPAP